MWFAACPKTVGVWKIQITQENSGHFGVNELWTADYAAYCKYNRTCHKASFDIQILLLTRRHLKMMIGSLCHLVKLGEKGDIVWPKKPVIKSSLMISKVFFYEQLS